MALVDTNVFIWLNDKNLQHNIGKKARHVLDSENVYASPFSIVEINIKSMLGKLNHEEVTEEKFLSTGVIALPFTAKHAECIADFQSLAKHDPFDRILLAQAVSENMTFLTADKTLLALNLDCVVDASQ